MSGDSLYSSSDLQQKLQELPKCKVFSSLHVCGTFGGFLFFWNETRDQENYFLKKVYKKRFFYRGDMTFWKSVDEKILRRHFSKLLTLKLLTFLREGKSKDQKC